MAHMPPLRALAAVGGGAAREEELLLFMGKWFGFLGFFEGFFLAIWKIG